MEIDTEVTQMLIDNAGVDNTLTWSAQPGIGVSLTEHYIGFAQLVARASAVIYARTQKFQATYMLISPDLLPIISFAPGFTSSSYTQVNGPFMVGVLNGIKVYVTPNMPQGQFVFGVNGNDMMTSAAVYAPYMPIVPTQTLQYADGGTSQGLKIAA